MPDNIVANTIHVNLDEEAAVILRECAAADAAGHACIDHALEAGRHLLVVHAQIGRGFRAWLQAHGLKKTLAYDYMLLAQNIESVRSSGHSSIAAALRMLRAKSSKKPVKSKKSNSTGSPLTKAAWTKATHDEQQNFLDAVGVEALLKAISFSFRAELKRRVAGQQKATTSGISDTIAAAFRHVLSLQKTTPAEAPAMGVVSGLNAINKKLKAVGLDLNDIVGITINPAAIIKKAA